jgi:hypothetical protein
MLGGDVDDPCPSQLSPQSAPQPATTAAVMSTTAGRGQFLPCVDAAWSRRSRCMTSLVPGALSAATRIESRSVPAPRSVRWRTEQRHRCEATQSWRATRSNPTDLRTETFGSANPLRGAGFLLRKSTAAPRAFALARRQGASFVAAPDVATNGLRAPGGSAQRWRTRCSALQAPATSAYTGARGAIESDCQSPCHVQALASGWSTATSSIACPDSG